MQQFNWPDMVNDELVTSICDKLSVNMTSTREEVRKLLGRLFEIVGGFPFLDSPLTDEAYRQIARGLLDDALREAYAKDIATHKEGGTILEDCDYSPIRYQIMLGELVHINWCTEKELSDLPDIGPKLAEKIIEERRRNGAFKSGEELSGRVSGIGEQTVTKLLRRIRFGQRPTAAPFPRDVIELVKFLADKTGASPDEGLRQILEYAITYLGTKKRIRWYADQYYDYSPPVVNHKCSWIGILRDSQYYYWLSDAIDKAKEKIDMAMFHIAMPAENHPTRLLLDKLIAAKKRGVEVRVLLDRDREEDVYKSTIINTDALETLKAGGVDARFDTEDRLLHSKFLVLDSVTAIVGSHNWSAGSYFNYDDITMVINSKSFAEELRQRFEQLWAVVE